MSSARRQRAVIWAAALPAVVIFGSAIPGIAQDIAPLEQLSTKQERAKLGVAAMSPERREALEGALLRTVRQGQSAAQQADRSRGITAGAGAVETQVDGDFIGWEGQTIVKLSNGQVWRQTEYHYEYHYAYIPKVRIFRSASGYQMRVDGTSKPIGVERLR